MTKPARSWESSALGLLPVLVFAGGLLWPLVWTIANSVTLVGSFEESVGYRYFYSLRVIYGGEYVFVPQGQLPDLVYQGLQQTLTFFGYRSDDLYPRIDVFIWLAVAAAHISAVAAFAWAVLPLRSVAARLSSALVWLLGNYLPGTAGPFVLLQPDYVSWILPVALVTAGACLRLYPSAREDPFRDSVGIGVLLGGSAAVKVTLILLPATLLLTRTLMGRGSMSHRLARVFWATAVGASVWLTVVVVYYRGDFRRMLRFVRDLSAFVEAIEPRAYHEAGGVFADRPLFLIVAVIALPLLLAAVMAMSRDRRKVGLCAALGCGFLAYLWVLLARPTPTTWFEVVVFLQTAFWLVAVLVKPEAVAAPQYRTALAGGLVVLMAIYAVPVWEMLQSMERTSESERELRRVLETAPGRIAFLIRDNEDRPLSVDSSILKGGGDIFGSFEASPLIGRMFPRRVYYLGSWGGSAAYRAPAPLDLEGVSTIVFTVPRERMLSVHVRHLEEEYETPLDGFNCDHEIDSGSQRIVVCAR